MKHFSCRTCQCLCYQMCINTFQDKNSLYLFALHPNILIHSSLHTFIPSLSLCQLGIVLLLYFWDPLSHLFPGSRSRSYFLCGAFSSSKLLQLIYCGILADFSSIKYMGRIKLLSLFFLAQRVSACVCADL